MEIEEDTEPLRLDLSLFLLFTQISAVRRSRFTVRCSQQNSSDRTRPRRRARPRSNPFVIRCPALRVRRLC
jgi:hypothetical protein